jgi:hypothetical protein
VISGLVDQSGPTPVSWTDSNWESGDIRLTHFEHDRRMVAER